MAFVVVVMLLLTVFQSLLVNSGPVPAIKCASILMSGIGVSTNIDDLFKSHECTFSNDFSILYRDNGKLLAKELKGNRGAETVCDGLAALIIQGITDGKFDQICRGPVFSKSFCADYKDKSKKELTELTKVFSKLPAGSRDAISALAALGDDEGCNNVCGGPKDQICFMVLHFGKALSYTASTQGNQ
jgi:hypothetical protein